MSFLHAHHSQKIDWRPLYPVAEKTTSGKSFLELYRFEQFSNAKDRKTRRDAILENINFPTSEIIELLPFISAAEILIVGSNTSYGFGKYEISILD